MRLRIWQAAFAALVLLAVWATIEGHQVANYSKVLFGRGTVGERGSPQWKLQNVPADSPAGKAGIVAGDVLNLDDSYMRYRFSVPGDTLSFVVTHQSVQRHVFLTVAGVPRKDDATDLAWRWLRALTQVFMIAMAIVIALRRPDLIAARALAMFLASWAFALSFDPYRHSGVVGMIGHFALNYAIAFSLMECMRFASSFTDGDTHGIRRFIYRAAPYFFGFMVADITVYLGLEYGWRWTEPALLSVWWACWAISLTTTLVALSVALGASGSKDRHRLLYVTLAFFIGFSGPIVVAWALGVLRVPPESAMYKQLVHWRLTTIAIPIGFGYALLHDHVLDVGFALNRAMLYGVVTSMIVPLFGLVKYFSDKVSHSTGNVVMTVLAVFLVSSLQQIQKKVQSLLDYLFFRDRAKVEKTLKGFAKEAAEYSEVAPLLERTPQVIDKSLGATGTAVYSQSEDTRYELRVSSFATRPPEMLDQDEADIVKLRAERESVYLKDTSHIAPNALMMPMMVHHRLLGFMVVGTKGDSRYAPDEQKVLEDVACAVGTALDALTTNQLMSENAALRARLDGLLDLVARRGDHPEAIEGARAPLP